MNDINRIKNTINICNMSKIGLLKQSTVTTYSILILVDAY